MVKQPKRPDRETSRQRHERQVSLDLAKSQRSWEDEAERALLRAKNILDQREWRQSIKANTIFSAFEVGKLAQINIDWISSETSLRLVDELIHDFNTEFFPVKEAGAFVGYVKAEKFRALLGQNQYSRNIFLRNASRYQVFIAVSRSGETEQVLDKARIARNVGMTVVAFTRASANPLAQLADLHFALYDEAVHFAAEAADITSFESNLVLMMDLLLLEATG